MTSLIDAEHNNLTDTDHNNLLTKPVRAAERQQLLQAVDTLEAQPPTLKRLRQRALEGVNGQDVHWHMSVGRATLGVVAGQHVIHDPFHHHVHEVGST